MTGPAKPAVSTAWGRSLSEAFRKMGGEPVEKTMEYRPVDYPAIREGKPGKLAGVAKRFEIPPPEMITPTSPLRLSVAAKIAFPDGSMSVSALRRMGISGHLTIERIAGKDFTTLANIEEMRTSCRVQAKAHGSTSRQPGRVTKQAMSYVTPSINDGSKSPAQEAARQILRKPKSSSKTTSPGNTTPKPGATVTPIK
jgi:hypothetical protein